MSRCRSWRPRHYPYQRGSQGDENPAADNEGQHVGYAVHQVLIDLTADAFFFGAFNSYRFRRRFRALINRGLAVEDRLNQFFRNLNAIGTLVKITFLPANAGPVRSLSTATIRRQPFDIGFSQVIFDPAGTVGFDFDVDAHGSCLVFQSFSSHVGMGNPRRACRNTDDEGAFRRSRFFSRCFFSSRFRRSFFSFGFDLFGFGFIDRRKVFFRRLSCIKASRKSSSISMRLRRLNTSKWTSAPPAGAAIMKNR